MTRKIKDSGVEWIGEIPEEWKIKKLKFVASIKSGEGITSNDLSEDGEFEVYGGNGVLGRCNTYNVEGSKLIIGRVGALCGNVRYVNKKLYVSDNALILSLKDGEINQYYYYLLDGANLGRLNTSNAQPLITGTKVLNLYIPDIDRESQFNIANYLDKKCSKIDETIEKEKQVMEKLKEYKQSVITEAVTKGLNLNVKMKDSGVEWIGEIPEHWENRKLKTLLLEAMKYGANESGEIYDENEPRYIRITDITLDSKLKDEGKLSLPLDIAKPYLLEDGDILFARSGATVGKSFIFKEEYGLSAFAGYLIKAKLNKNIAIPQFVFYYTLSNSYNEWKKRIFIQATIQNIGADKYSNMNVAIPTINEQQQIVDYLDKKCSSIDKLISNKEKLIEKLTEYKKSLIYECVTGKREV